MDEREKAGAFGAVVFEIGDSLRVGYRGYYRCAE